MARYVYNCPEHGNREVYMNIKHHGDTTWLCPECKAPMKQVFTPPAIIIH